MNQEIMQEILTVALALCAVLITRYVLPAINAYLKGKNAENLEKLIEDLVNAAEQLIRGSKQGDKKLSYVEDMLAAQGIKMDDNIRAKVEAKVYQLNGGGTK